MYCFGRSLTSSALVTAHRPHLPFRSIPFLASPRVASCCPWIDGAAGEEAGVDLYSDPELGPQRR